MANPIGLITINGKHILEVDAIPGDGAGTAAPVGSLAMYEDGSNIGHLYVKTGAADTAWQEVDIPENNDWELLGNTLTGGTPGTPTQWIGSKNDYDVVFKRNNAEVMRMAAGNLLVGLAASLGGKLQIGVATLGDELIKQVSPNGGAGAQVIHVTRQYKLQTTDATPAALASILVPASSRIQANMMIVCNQHGGTGGAVGNGASYERTIDAKRLASGDAVLKKFQTDFTSEDVNQLTVTATVNTNNIDVYATGSADCNYAWFGHTQILIAAN